MKERVGTGGTGEDCPVDSKCPSLGRTVETRRFTLELSTRAATTSHSEAFDGVGGFHPPRRVSSRLDVQVRTVQY
jgi:hypothetical protein